MSRIYYQIQGGLGNQLFIIAFAISQALRHPEKKIYLDPCKYYLKKIHEGYLLKDLISQCSSQLPNPIHHSMFSTVIFSFLNKISLLNQNYTFHHEVEPYIFHDIAINSKNTFLFGYWQSYKYFFENSHYLKKIILDFIKIHQSSDKMGIAPNKNLAPQVAIHVRRGDYVKLKSYGLLSKDYYQQAIKYFQKEIPNAQFLVFSDQPNDIKNENLFECPVVYIQSQKSSINELYLMSQCDHFITANSSFSWWGAYLGENTSKIILTPKKWFKDREPRRDFIPPDWILIDNELD